LSIGIHVSAIVFIPALFYLMFWKWRREGKGFFSVFSVISILGSLVVIFLALWYVFLNEGEGNSFEQFIPLFSSAATKFTLFSPAHLNEMTNQLLLVSPVGIFLFLFFLFYVVKYKYLRDPIINYLLLSSLAGLFLIFVYNAHLGIADWDLRSLPGIFVTLVGVFLFIKWGNQWPRFKNYGLILIAVSFFHVIPWIALNASTRMSVNRYVMTSMNDPHLLYVKGGGIWRAGRALVQAGFQERAIDIFEYGIEKDPTQVANYSYIAIYLSTQRKWDEAIVYLQKGLKVDPQSRSVRSHLVDIFLLKGEVDKALFYLDNIKLDQPEDSALVVSLARPLLRAERFGETKQLLQDYLNKNQGTAAIHGLMGMILFFERDESSARIEWEKALKLNPNESVSLKGMKELRKIQGK
jgi:Flp pilus assembly protein TadD